MAVLLFGGESRHAAAAGAAVLQGDHQQQTPLFGGMHSKALSLSAFDHSHQVVVILSQSWASVGRVKGGQMTPLGI